MVTVSGNSNSTNPTNPTTINLGELTDKNQILYNEHLNLISKTVIFNAVK